MGHTHRHRPSHLARKLRTIRKNLGLTQAELIKGLKVDEPLHPASISQYEQGKREPSLPVIVRYAELAGCSTDYLIDDRLELPGRRCKRVVR
ncbi:MAG TPA: helix-turn-helix transcriptional regulator [Chlamydiales bacterium]|jgi:transcriptional regulator with XRE-family HTH domain|nr:helix-turn-helix transcriptional regulator [Chlamydiales bacterium]